MQGQSPVAGSTFRYHAGRLVVSQGPNGWVAVIKTRSETVEVLLSATKPDVAIIEAEQLYADARAVTNPKPYCWQCIHWEPVKSNCGLGFPEGRKSGGRFANQCSAFWAD